MKNQFLVIVILAMLSGCADHKPKRFVDTNCGIDSQIVELLSIGPESVTIQVGQNLAPAYLADVDVEVIEGHLYLFPRMISSVVHQTTFVISLKQTKLPEGWQNKIYWVCGEAVDSPLNPFDESFHEIRRRVLIKKAESKGGRWQIKRKKGSVVREKGGKGSENENGVRANFLTKENIKWL